jgi:hypothetical protein
MTWTSPHALGVVFSPEHGLLFWTPLVALAVAGLVWALLRQTSPLTPTLSPTSPEASSGRRSPGGGGPQAGRGSRRDVALALLLALASQIYVAGSVESWTVAGAFGQRRFVGLTAVFVVGLAMFISRVVAAPGVRPRGSLRTVAVWTIVTLAVWWNLGLTMQFGAGLMDRQRLEPRLNAWHTFVTIPARLPDLAYRYVFERSSFYRPQAAPEPSPRR